MEILLNLFFTFLKIGTFSFGGGYAMLPFIEREVITNNSWLSLNEFMDVLGISQMTPGPVSINSATFIGHKMSGVFGSIAATLGVITTSFILVSIASKTMEKFKESKILKGALTAMKPVLVALIVKAFLNLAVEVYLDWKSIVVGIIIAVGLFYKKINPLILIAISAILGLVFWR